MASTSFDDADLRFLSESVRSVLSKGLWFLYQCRADSVPQIAFYLVTGQSGIFLDRDGNPVDGLTSRPVDLILGDRIQFEPAVPAESLVQLNFA